MLTGSPSSTVGLNLRYIDYLTKFRWDLTKKTWVARKSKRTPTVGRLAYVHPSCGELFYLRILLTYQTGCCSFEDIRKVSGTVMPTYREACEKLGLIGDDKEWETTISEAAEWASGPELRSLFMYLLLYCDVSNPAKLWEQNWRCMSDDISYHLQQSNSTSSSFVNTDDLQQYVLFEMQVLLNSNSSSKSLTDFGLPSLDPTVISALENSLLFEEKNYDRRALQEEHTLLHSGLHREQLHIYDLVMRSIASSSQILLFVYGHGGTGKTYLWKTLIAGLRSTGCVVLAVAASGIASLLLPGGRTAHSRFKIPLELTNDSFCNIKKNTNLCQLLLETSLIIWDEAPMNDRRCFESLDKTLQDLTNNTSQLFGGKSVLLGGDFRQCLPVKPKCTKAEVIDSSLPRSYIWKHLTVCKLTENMRLATSTATEAGNQEVQEFSSWLLQVGDGHEGVLIEGNNRDVRQIKIPSQYLLDEDCGSLQQLIKFIYDTELLSCPTPALIAERAIICPKK